MKLKKPGLLVVSILLCQLAGVIGSLFTRAAVSTWYAQLNKPAFNPPNWLFGPVWITLYTLMGVALYLVWQRGFKKPAVAVSVKLFLVHLVFNSGWSIVFFGLKNPGLALMVIVILWLMIWLLIRLFGKIDKKASYLLVPYFLWVSFAMVLNYSIWQLN